MRRRPTAKLLAVLATVSVLYSAYVVAGVGGGGSTSSPWAPPTIAVDIYAFSVIPGLFGLNDTSHFKDDACFEACKTWRGTCRGIVKEAKSCVISSIAKSTNVFEEGCQNFLDPNNRIDCKSSVKFDEKSFKEEVKLDAKIAEGCCEDFFEPCIAACLSGNESLIPECFSTNSTDPM